MRAKLLAASIVALASPVFAGEIWVTNERGNTVSVIDVESLELTRTIDVGQRPRGIIFSKDHSKVYICASDDDTVQVLDPNSGEALFELPSGYDPEQFALPPNARFLYLANEDDGHPPGVATGEPPGVATNTPRTRPVGFPPRVCLHRFC